MVSTVTNQLRELSVHTLSLNPSFKALDDDVHYATKEKVELERPIKILTQFPITQGVTWGETAEE